MPIFGDREKAEEARYAKRRELRFRIKARRNKLLASWAATKMGRTAKRAEHYVSEFARDEMTEHVDDAVVGRLRDDLLAEGILITEAEIRVHLENFEATATRELAPDAPLSKK
jgi:hypothetical protein